MKKISILLLINVLSIHFLKAQSPVLDNYIKLGLDQNLTLKNENFELQKALENIAIAKANFSPKITFAPNYSLAAGGRRLEFPIGDLLNPVYSTLNQITKTTKFPQVENVNQLLAPNNFHDTKISFQYPVFNTDIQYNYLIQKELMNGVDAKRRILENEVRYNITLTYIQYLQALEGLKIIGESKKILNEFVRFNQKLVNNNVATKDIVYAAEYEVAKLSQQKAGLEKNREMAKTYLNYLMNRDFSEDVEADSNLIKTLPAIPELSTFRADALLNRSEINQLKSGIKVGESLIKMQVLNAKRPQVFIGGNTGFQGFGYKFAGQAYLVAQVGLNFDLYHGNEKSHKIQLAKINNNQLEAKKTEVEKQIELQVSQAYFELEAASKSLEAAKEGIVKAGKTLQFVASKYRNGQALYIEYLKAQNDDFVAKLTESVGRYDIWAKKAMLDKVVAVK